MMNYLVIDKLITSALEEDIPNSDITTDSIIDCNSKSKVDLIAKENGIIAGLQVFERVFTLLGDVSVEFYKKDGGPVKSGDILAVVSGSTKSILSGERTALNYLQRMSGVATITNKFVNKLQGSNTRLLDTRKTTPNMRILEKYAVKIGGGYNHRFNLSDGVLLKDNHISAAGGVKNAIKLARENTSFVRKIEVEVENIEMVKEAIEEAADIIMLDNMDIEAMKRAVALINKRALTECSGNVTLDNIEEVAKTGVDFVSVGALTHSAGILDLSMKNLTNL